MFHAFVGRGPTIADADALRAQALRHPQAVRDRDRGLRARRPQVSSTSRACRAARSSTRGCSRPTRSADYFADDLGDPLLTSALCMVHSRFSTNTFPSWELAHPYRMISHNGEINTLRGNINWMQAREALFASDLFEPATSRSSCRSSARGCSDSACLDNAVELLVTVGLQPAARDDDADPRGVGKPRDDVAGRRRTSTSTTRCLMEPWDGPASIAFTDGKTIGAVLDRNGLRPSRYVRHQGRPGHHGLRGRRARRSRPRTSCSRGGSSRARCSWSTSSRAGSSTTRS